MNETEPEDRALTSALRAVAEDDERSGPSAAVERRLLAEVQSIARARETRTRVVPLAAAAALLVAIALPAWYASTRRSVAERGAVSDRDPGSTREEATEFFPLPYSDVPAPGGYMVRMQVPRTVLTSFGVTTFVAPDDRSATVLADVLVGGDGLARAVRFVRVVRGND